MSTSRGGEEMYGRAADDRRSLQTMSVSSIFKEYMFDPGNSNCGRMQNATSEGKLLIRLTNKYMQF